MLTAEVGEVLAGERKWGLHIGDCLEGMRLLPGNCVSCVVTSPPYFGLRDYGTGKWEGGSSECKHLKHDDLAGQFQASTGLVDIGTTQAEGAARAKYGYRKQCQKCGAVRVDQQIGLEETPSTFVAKLVEVFAEVRRVLHPSGTLWVNMGDSYANDTKWGGSGGGEDSKNYTSGRGGCVGQKARRNTGLKPKDLMGIPWMLAFALRDSGWYLRSDIPWVKRSPMPESTADRPSKALEYVFLLSKSQSYHFDMDAVRQKAEYGYRDTKGEFRGAAYVNQKGPQSNSNGNGGKNSVTGKNPDYGRNFRNTDLWFQSISQPHGLVGVGDDLVGLDVTSEPLRDAHFAAFPSAIVRPCVLAGSSEHGVCPTCYSPWRRIVERSRKPTRPGKNTKVTARGEVSPVDGGSGEYSADGRAQFRSASEVGNRDPQRHCTTRQTTGWEPGCKCDAGKPIPSLVLDPFAGSGTTLSVAVQLGRRAIGFELNPEYAALARKRVCSGTLMKDERAAAEPLPLFQEM